MSQYYGNFSGNADVFVEIHSYFADAVKIIEAYLHTHICNTCVVWVTDTLWIT